MKKVLMILFVSALVLGIVGLAGAQQSAQQRGYMGGRTGQFQNQDQSRDYGRQSAYGQQQQGQYGGQQGQQWSRQQMSGNFERASDLMDKKVKNQQGEDLGQVSDLILARNGQVAYMIISHGGVMGVGDRYVPVPFRDAQWNAQQNAFVLPNVDKQKLANAPTIGKDDWQKLEDPSFGRQIFSYYGQQGQQMQGQQQWGTQQQQQPMQQQPMQQQR